MANLNVTLVYRCKTENGWKRFPVEIGKNGKVKPPSIPGGRYQLRMYEGSKMIYKDAGASSAQALTLRLQAEHTLAAKNAAAKAGTVIVETSGRKNLKQELDKFVEAAEIRGSKRAAVLYRQAGDDFLSIVKLQYADEITKEHLNKHLVELRKRGQSKRTVYNRNAVIRAFLKYLKLNVAELAPKISKGDKKLPEVYKPEELKKLFASITDEKLKLTYELLLKSGIREREAVYLFWSNVDLKAGTIKIVSKPELGFTIKDAEERIIPLPADLIKKLKAYREAHPNEKFVTGTSNDTPNGKLLLRLKRAAKNAGLDQGDFWLHKFRSTYITTLLRQGMDLRTVMKLSGHSDLASVMRYLTPANDEEVKAKLSKVKWM